MFPPNIDQTYKISKIIIKERLKEAETLRRLHFARVIQESRIPHPCCKLIAHVAHQLVHLGHRLEQFEISPRSEGLRDG